MDSANHQFAATFDAPISNLSCSLGRNIQTGIQIKPSLASRINNKQLDKPARLPAGRWYTDIYSLRQ